MYSRILTLCSYLHEQDSPVAAQVPFVCERGGKGLFLCGSCVFLYGSQTWCCVFSMNTKASQQMVHHVKLY